MTSARYTIGDLKKVLPTQLIVDSIAVLEKQSTRVRKLPDQLVAWLVVALGLYRSEGAGCVLEHVAKLVGVGTGWGPAERPHSTSITQARDRLGWEVLREIYRRQVAKFGPQPCDQVDGLTVLALDGSTFMTPDSTANDLCFGRPPSSRGEQSAFPQLRSVGLMGVKSHVLYDAAFGPYKLSELKLAEQLIPRLMPNSLLLLDRAYDSLAWPARLQEAGTKFVIRLRVGKTATRPIRERSLGENEWSFTLGKGTRYLKRRYPELIDEVECRKIEVKREGLRSVFLLTNLLDRKKWPASRVVELFKLRWEIETGFRELKTQLVGVKVAFRSQTPERVLQEAYGLLVAYNSIRLLMCEAAKLTDAAPNRLSFTTCLRATRRHLTLARLAGRAASDQLIIEMAYYALPPPRVGRRCDRAVKLKFSNYPRKRTEKQAGPTRRQQAAIRRERASLA